MIAWHSHITGVVSTGRTPGFYRFFWSKSFGKVKLNTIPRVSEVARGHGGIWLPSLLTLMAHQNEHQSWIWMQPRSKQTMSCWLYEKRETGVLAQFGGGNGPNNLVKHGLSDKVRNIVEHEMTKKENHSNGECYGSNKIPDAESLYRMGRILKGDVSCTISALDNIIFLGRTFTTRQILACCIVLFSHLCRKNNKLDYL